MTSQINEQLSAYLDGELPQDELPLLLRQLEKQPHLLAEAQRLQQAHLCVLGEQPAQPLSVATTFCQNVHDAIYADSEFDLDATGNLPIYDFTTTDSSVADSSAATQQGIAANLGSTDNNDSNQLESEQIAMGSVQTAPAANDRFWKPLAGAGIAAAVAMLAVNLWQPNAVSPNTGITNQVANTTAVAPTTKVDNTADSYVVPTPATNSNSLNFVQPGDIQVVNYSPYVKRHVSSANTSAGNQLQRYTLLMQEFEEDEQRAKELMESQDKLATPTAPDNTPNQ